MIDRMTDFYLIFQRLSDQDRAELAARTALKITDGLAKHIQAAGAGLRQAAVEVISSASGSGWCLTPAFDSYLSEHGLPRAAVE